MLESSLVCSPFPSRSIPSLIVWSRCCSQKFVSLSKQQQQQQQQYQIISIVVVQCAEPDVGRR